MCRREGGRKARSKGLLETQHTALAPVASTAKAEQREAGSSPIGGVQGRETQGGAAGEHGRLPHTRGWRPRLVLRRGPGSERQSAGVWNFGPVSFAQGSLPGPWVPTLAPGLLAKSCSQHCLYTETVWLPLCCSPTNFKVYPRARNWKGQIQGHGAADTIFNIFICFRTNLNASFQKRVDTFHPVIGKITISSKNGLATQTSQFSRQMTLWS